MIDHAIKEGIDNINRLSRYREVELKASIISDWLSSERNSNFFQLS